MANPLVWQISSTGISVPTQAQLLAFYQAQMLQIYGVDLTVQDPSSPDNQELNIFIQALLDEQNLAIQTCSTFDPDQAIGTVLDQRVAINGIQREAATYSTVNITVVISTTSTVYLYGLDQTSNQIFTVQDASGNQWNLLTSQYGLTSATYILAFQSAVPGAVLTSVDTLTIQTTPVIGVSSVNNPTAQTFIGTDEESDAALKIRRQQAVSLPSQGYLDGLLAALLNIPGVTYANVIENDTGTTITSGPNTGLPGHSIWCIIAAQNEGATSTQSSVAYAIYAKRNAGCGMYGGESFVVTRPNGNSITMYWDWVSPVDVYSEFNALSIDGINLPQVQNIQSQLPVLFDPNVSQSLTGNMLSSAVQEIDPNTFVTAIGFSVGVYQVFYLSGVAASGTFYLTYNSVATASVSWNASLLYIQTQLRALTGLGSVVVTGGAYIFTVTSANATIGATYTNNSNTYTVLATISSGTTLLVNCTTVGATEGAPAASGTLTKATGTGDSTITFSAYAPPLASQNMMVYMAGVTSPLLIGVETNTLETSGSATVTMTQMTNRQNIVQTITFSDVAASGAFTINYNGHASSSIAWNASLSTIQSDVQALTGLTSVTVSGSIASKTLAIVMVGVAVPVSLFTVGSNTLETGSSVAISTIVTSNFPSNLAVTSALQQFSLPAGNSVILSSPGSIFITAPSVVNSIIDGVVTYPCTLAIVHAATTTFTGFGGYGAITYSVTTGTGSTINATSGAYVAGSAGSDTVTATDALGNTATCTVTIS